MKLAAFLQKAYSVLDRLDLVLPENPAKPTERFGLPLAQRR